MAILFVLLVLLSWIVLVCIYDAKRQARFEVEFPPISDREYLALCKPGTDPRVALTVRKTLAEALAVDYERIHPTARLVDDLGAD